MRIKLIIAALILIPISFTLSQNAVDYFPSQLGYKWYTKTTPFDSLQQPIDSLSYYQIDSLAANVTFKDKPSKLILSKMGTKDIILDMPFIDSTYLSLETSNVWNYMSSFLGIDTAGIGGFLSGIEGWYNTFRLSSAVNSQYTVFTKDTNITYNGTGFIVTLEVKAKRLADQVLTTPIGTFTCKKFLLNPAVKAKLALLPIITYTLVMINDTVYIAPGNFIVKDVRPSANVDLSLLTLPSFFVPGSITEILRYPAIVNAAPLLINVPFTSGDSVFTVSNSGNGTLRWHASVTLGNEWLRIISDSTGTNNSTVRFSFTTNTTSSARFGTIRVWDDSAFGGEGLITINQNQPSAVYENNQLPSEYRLFDNYPNPFNPSTNIKFAVPKAGNISLTVYNIIGKEVAVLVNENKPAGIYEVKFNASQLSSGIYFYKLNANGFTSVKKMILMK